MKSAPTYVSSYYYGTVSLEGGKTYYIGFFNTQLKNDANPNNGSRRITITENNQN